MVAKQVIRAASGWLELGMPDDALEELEALQGDDREERSVLELKLSAEMAKEHWKEGAETAAKLCRLAVNEHDFFLSVAFCLHEMGDTEEARNWLQRGPEVLSEFPVYHYNMACYHWALGEKERAKNHLARAIDMDDSFLEAARDDRDLIGMDF